ncbi:MAG: cytochrome C [Gallionellaceae bacterium]|nr:cytochrome C [Gallionellaceae bacterium]
MNIHPFSVAGLAAIALLAQTATAADPGDGAKLIERGQYLIRVSGCNDCHTPGYPESDGKVPAQQWLTGSPVGFQGPWGTSYPGNLRLRLHGLSEAQWLARARQPMRPPMPWFNLSAMTDRDLVAIYRFVRNLGPAGEPAPAAAAPGVQVATPYIEFVPKNLPASAKHAER